MNLLLLYKCKNNSWNSILEIHLKLTWKGNPEHKGSKSNEKEHYPRRTTRQWQSSHKTKIKGNEQPGPSIFQSRNQKCKLMCCWNMKNGYVYDRPRLLFPSMFVFATVFCRYFSFVLGSALHILVGATSLDCLHLNMCLAPSTHCSLFIAAYNECES